MPSPQRDVVTVSEIQAPSSAQDTSPVPMSQAERLFENIIAASKNPDVDVEKMERLYELARRARAEEAKRAFFKAMAELQPELPTVEKKGRIVVYKKDAPRNEANIIQTTPYALWDDINEAIKPILAKHGFSLTYRPGQTAEGKITVTGILSHRDGHQEEATMVLPHDSTGSKNPTQAIGSSNSYGKRYAAGALLNLTFKGEDDDAAATATATDRVPDLITPEQVVALRTRIKELEANEEKLLAMYKVAKLEDLTGANYVAANKKLDQRQRGLARESALA